MALFLVGACVVWLVPRLGVLLLVAAGFGSAISSEAGLIRAGLTTVSPGAARQANVATISIVESGDWS